MAILYELDDSCDLPADARGGLVACRIGREPGAGW